MMNIKQQSGDLKMIKRVPGKKKKVPTFTKAKAKTTKADKRRDESEVVKKIKAENLHKAGPELPQNEPELPQNVKNLVKKKKYDRYFLDDGLRSTFWKEYLASRSRPGLGFVAPRKPIDGLSPKKSYKVIHVDVQKLSGLELEILKRERTLNKKKKKVDLSAHIVDRDDEEYAESKRRKNSEELEYFTVVWLLIGGNDRMECQWVNAEDVYFL